MLKLSFLSLLLISSFASAEEERRADAHAHGLNNFSMVISQNQVAITYEMPIVQLLDEHDEHDENDENDEHDEDDKLTVSDESLAEFQNYSQLFAFPKGANCDLVSFKSELHSVSTEGDHKDVELSYEFSCNEPSQLKSITINAFNHFSELENLYFEAVINNKALTKSLKSDVDKVIF
jgi:hypothetical protein